MSENAREEGCRSVAVVPDALTTCEREHGHGGRHQRGGLYWGTPNRSDAASVRQPPVRLCCMQRHDGPVCPDGKVMCCLCFGRFAVEDLNVSYGTPEDVCRDCAAREAEARV